MGHNKICKNCTNWYNKQKELEYVNDFGFCNENMFSSFEDNLTVKIIPHDSFCNIHHDFLNQDGSLFSHKFDLATHESFGCVHFKKR